MNFLRLGPRVLLHVRKAEKAVMRPITRESPPIMSAATTHGASAAPGHDSVMVCGAGSTPSVITKTVTSSVPASEKLRVSSPENSKNHRSDPDGSGRKVSP